MKSEHQTTKRSIIPEGLKEKIEKTEAYKSISTVKDGVRAYIDESSSFAAEVTRKI